MTPLTQIDGADLLPKEYKSTKELPCPNGENCSECAYDDGFKEGVDACLSKLEGIGVDIEIDTLSYLIAMESWGKNISLEFTQFRFFLRDVLKKAIAANPKVIKLIRIKDAK